LLCKPPLGYTFKSDSFVGNITSVHVSFLPSVPVFQSP